MGFSLGGSKEKSRQETVQNTNQTSTFNPNQQFLDMTQTGLNSALGMMGGFNRTTGADVQGYLNPMQDTISAGIRRSGDIAANQNDAQAASAAAFGGTGWGLLRGETARGFADAEAASRAQGYNTALQAAMGENAAGHQFNQNALQTYLSGLGLLGNWGTTNTTGNMTGLNKGTASGFNAKLTGSF